MVFRWSVSNQLVVETDIQATVLTTEVGESVVWLASASTGQTVEGAHAYVYKNTKPRKVVAPLQQQLNV